MTSALLSRERIRRLKNPWAMRRAVWLSTARANQLPPPGDWDLWMNRSGRGNGKTRSGSEEGSDQVRRGGDGWRGLLIGRTFRDVRDVMVEGPAGLLSVIPKQYVLNWNRSLGELTLHNGGRFECFGAEDVDIIRGHEYHWAWLDELAAYRYDVDMLDAVRFTLRAGEHPRLIVTTTPRPTKLIRELEDLTGAFESRLVDCRFRQFVTTHAAYGYLADRFDRRKVLAWAYAVNIAQNIVLAILVLTAFAVTISTRFSQVMTLIFCVAVFCIGLLADHLVGPELVDGQYLEQSLIHAALYAALPNFQFFWLADALTQEQEIPGSHVLRLMGYTALYIPAVLAMGVAMFQTREVG